MAAVVPIVLSVAVDLAGGESATCLYHRARSYVGAVDAVRVVVVHVAPRGTAAAAHVVLTVVVVVHVVVVDIVFFFLWFL